MHPATKILLWLFLALIMQWLSTRPLLVLSAMTTIALLMLHPPQANNLLRRTRWLFLSLILIYAFATPGSSLLPQWGPYSPTTEGVRSGVMQAWRLVLLLLALALLMASSTRENLLAGLYTLLRPFKIIGANPERAAVRLWLTLHYAEQGAAIKPNEWMQTIQHGLEPPAITVAEINLQVPKFTWLDAFILAIATLLCVAALA